MSISRSRAVAVAARRDPDRHARRQCVLQGIQLHLGRRGPNEGRFADIRGTLVSRHVATEGLLPVAPDRTVSLAVDRGPAVRTRVEVADLAIDGALGTEYLMAQPVTLDLSAPPPGR